MTRSVHDRYLPPDHEAFVAAEPPTGRVIVIAPTRAACETIELALGLDVETYLERTRGHEIRELAGSGKGFGIVAGTGTGKTLAIRPIAQRILGTDQLRVGVVNREREATPETPTWNVIIVTTGIARRWFQDNDILPTDTLVVDEIHQTSAELELCLALGKRVGCRFVWLSATVDPSFYWRYLGSADVLEVYDFDEKKAATVKVVSKGPLEFLDDRFLQHVSRGKRGVALFVPTRAMTEESARHVEERYPRIHTAFYHGGEPIRVIRAFLEEGETAKPYFLSMTAAGQSALNVRGLDTVIIDDTRFTNIIEGGKNVLTRLHLGANEILQMAGRVHGRVEGGRVFILSDRDIDFGSLRPTEPEFQLAGEAERVALTCADIGVRADELELPVPLDKASYRKAVEKLEGRHIIEKGRLTPYGKSVEALPCDRPWAELIVNADDELIPYLAVMSSIESLHRMTREERDLDGLVVPGSDHLTAYNIYAEAYAEAGYMGAVYGLPRHLFDEKIVEQWAERRGVLVKSIEDTALAMASVYRAVGLELPAEMPNAGERVLRKFQELLAQYMPFDLVIDEETAEGGEARVSKTSVCGSWGPIAGELRYFADKFGVARAGIEGTQVPMDLIRRYAHRGAAELVYDPKRRHAPLALRRRVEYYGFVLEREVEPIEDVFPPELAEQARAALADSMARFEARHVAVKRNRPAIEEIREMYRRSGGRTPRLGQKELAALYLEQLDGVGSLQDFRAAPLRVSVDDFVPPDERERLWKLPDAVEIRGREIPIDYDVEQASVPPAGEEVAATNDAEAGTPYKPEPQPVAIARLRLPEKMARTLSEAELPALDRPIRFVVLRGQRGAVRASTLDELQEKLDRPWSPDEAGDRGASRMDDAEPARADDDRLSPAEREVKELARQMGWERDRQRRPRRHAERRNGERRNGDRDVAEDRADRRGREGGPPGSKKRGRRAKAWTGRKRRG